VVFDVAYERGEGGMTPREFLLGWLMEFGSGPVTQDEMYLSDWYMSDGNVIDADTSQMYADERLGGPYLLAGNRGLKYPYDDRYYQITQAGLDFIKGE
jgi:hypothetical protein